MIYFTDKGRIAFRIDDDDYEAVSRYPWAMYTKGYPCTHIGKWPTERSTSLHQFLMGRAPKGFEWDHINRDKLDNRRANLRMVTRQQNSYNVGNNRNNKSGVSGVIWSARVQRWLVRIKINKKEHHLGSFRQFEMACAKRWAAEKYRALGLSK